MSNEFKPRCPNCLSANHGAARLRVHYGRIDFGKFGKCLDLGPVYGEAMRHCNVCGSKFLITRAVELRELPLTTEWHECEITMRCRLLDEVGA